MAPAGDRPIRAHRAGVIGACDDLGDPVEIHDGPRGRAPVIWIAVMLQYPSADLSIDVVSPALHEAIGEERAGVCVAGVDGHSVRDAVDEAWLDEVLFVLEAELAGAIVSPALDAAICEKRATLRAYNS